MLLRGNDDLTEDIFAQVEKEAQTGPRKRTFAGFKSLLRFNDGSVSINTDVRYARLDFEPLVPCYSHF